MRINYSYVFWIAIVFLILVFGVGVANAATDLGDGACQQTDGQTGLWNGTTADDEGCITQAEYQVAYPTDDGSDPLDRQVSVDVELEPEAPTVREFFEDPMVRLAELGLTVE